MTRTTNSLRNTRFALGGQILSIAISFVARKVFVSILGEEYLGLSGLFSNILTMLSLAELGVGTAIVYSLYRPLAEGNTEKIKTLMRLYQRTYTLIGIIIGIVGIGLTPFIHIFVKQLPDITHIQLIYILFVLNSASSYFFVYRRSLIIADQKRYLDSLYHSIFLLLMNITQIIILFVRRNYLLYLISMLFFTIAENLCVSLKAVRMYPYLRERNVQQLGKDDSRAIFRNVMAMMFHKVGGVIVMGTDNLIIGRFVGVVAVGLYSNYLLVIAGLRTIAGIIFQSLTASFGNLHVVADNSRKKLVFERLLFLGAWIYGFISIGLMAMVNPLISLWLGEQYVFDFSIVLTIVINFYITGMRQPCSVAREAMGLFWYDRYKPAFESAINLVASILLVRHMGISGVLIGTIISTMTTCFWVEPFVLYKHGFHRSSRSYFLQYALYALVTLVGACITMHLCMLISDNGYLAFLKKFFLCLLIPNLLYILCYSRTPEFAYFLNLATRVLTRKRSHEEVV